MDQNSQKSRDRSARRMDGLGSSASSRKTNAPLDLRAAPSARPVKPVRPVKRPNLAPSPAPSVQKAPLATPTPAPAEPPSLVAQKSNYDDPLHGLVDSDDVPLLSHSPLPAPLPAAKPIKKRTFWRSFLRFMVVLLILLFIISAGLFIYLSYFQGQ